MLRHRDRWLRDRDLGESPLGREDSPELIEQCLGYLADHPTGEYPVLKVSRATDRKTKAELLSAHVQASVRNRQAPSDLGRRLAEAEATIDRLLAYVPGRAHELEEGRVADLAAQLSTKAAELIPSAKRIRVTVVPETDGDSMACHRVTLVLGVPQTLKPTLFASATTQIHRWLAANSLSEEYEAIRLVVEPELI